MSTTAPIDRPRRRSLFRGRKPSPEYQVHLRPDGSRDVELPLTEHLRELRDRLIKAGLAVVLTTVLCLTFADQLVQVLVRLAEPNKLQALSPTETFTAYLKVAFYAGLALSMPIIVYQLFRFLAPGLTKSERRWVYSSLPAITIFFVGGVVFCYFIVLPSALGFLLGFGGGTIEIVPTVSNFLSFVTRFLLAVGIAFETPVIVFVLAMLGVATPLRLRKFRRWAYVLAFVLAAIITPTPDPINQAVVAIPIIILYELGTLFSRVAVKNNKGQVASSE